MNIKIAEISVPRAIAASMLVLASSSILAQSNEVPAGLTSPIYSLTDPNGINLVSNKPSAKIDDVSIGSSERQLAHTTATAFSSGSQPSIYFADAYTGSIVPAPDWNPSSNCVALGIPNYIDVMLAGVGDRMCGVNGNYISQRETGSTLVVNANGTVTYTRRDGTQFLFGIGPNNERWLSRITSADGMVTTLAYKSTSLSGGTSYRVQSVTRSDGLQLKYTYESNTAPTSPSSPWFLIASVRAINNAVEYCDPQADSCTFTQSWPVTTQVRTVNGALRYFALTDAGGAATRFTLGIPTLSGGAYGPSGPSNFISTQLLAIRGATSTSADTITYTYCAPWGEYLCMKQGVRKLNTNGFDWTYSGTSGTGGPSVFIQLTSTRPGGGSRVIQQQMGNSAQGPLISYADNLSLQTFNFESSHANRLWFVTRGDGDKLTFTYDGRGNITQETRTPKSGSSLPVGVKLANYDATCANTLKCNKPNWVRDAKGNQTDYEYDPVSGGVVAVTAPAPVAGGVRPQTRYTYAQRYAWYKNASGSFVQAATPIWLTMTKKLCRQTAALANGAGCAIAADEVVTTYDYGPSSGPNNLFLRGEAVTADGVTLRTCYGYDIYGNRISETSPKAGLSSCP